MNDLRSVQLGPVLYVGPSERPTEHAVRLAAALAPDPGRLLVVADPQAPGWREDSWPGLADLLRGRGPVRLAMAAAGSARSGPQAQWLADRVGAEIIAPDGPLAPVGNRLIHVVGGTWLAFRPGQVPMALGARFPQPRWEHELPRGVALTDAAAEAVPAGLWIRGGGTAGQPDIAVRACLLDLSFSFDTITVVLGSPDATRSPVPEFVALRDAAPVLAAPSVRIVPYWYGPAVIGQELADRSAASVVTTVGVPVGNNGQVTMFLHDSRGNRTWQPFAFEVRYTPGGVPLVTRWRPPLPGLPRSGPGGPIFPMGNDILLEIVQSGLWLRRVGQRIAPEVRAQPADPNWAKLTVGVPGENTPETLAAAAAALTARLDPQLRHYLRMSIEQAGQPGTGTTPRAKTVAARVADVPSAVSAFDTTPTAPIPGRQPAAAPASAAQSVRRTVAYPALDPRHSSTTAEQDWLLEHLGAGYGRHSSAAIRMVAGQPALRLLADAPRNAVVADLVAVSAYLEQGRAEIESSLAEGSAELAMPYLNCVVSGLRRLPSYRGVAFAGASINGDAAALAPGATWTDAEVRQAVATPDVALSGPIEFVVWSVTGRRLDALDPQCPVRRIAFPPGSRFQVLDGGRADGPVRSVLLRELTAAAPDGVDIALRDKLAAAAGQRLAMPADDRPHAPDEGALTWQVDAADLVAMRVAATRVTAPAVLDKPRPIATRSVVVARTAPTPQIPDDSWSWDAGSAEFLPLLTREG